MDRLVFPGKGIRYGEIWFAEEAPAHLADIILGRQSLKPLTNGQCREFWSIEINLAQSPETLLECVDKNTRYEIRRAESKDGLTSEFWLSPGDDVQTAFMGFYNAAACTTGRENVQPAISARYAKAGMLGLSRVSRDGQDIAWHAYILAGKRARLWLSGTAPDADRALSGRANRLLHWRDMIHLKDHQYEVYDFGGWYEGNTDRKLLSINQFKEQFGGNRVCHYDCVIPQSLRGKLYLWLQAVLGRQNRQQSN